MPLPTGSKEERDKESKWLAGAKLPTSWGPKRKKRSVPSTSKGRDKADASKLDATVKSLINDLNLAGRNYTKRLQSHRDQVYDSMQTAQRAIAECLNDRFVHTSFIQALQRKAKSGGGRSFKLSLEAMALAMGATALRARKLASKRAKVLDFARAA